MADVKIADLTATTVPASGDELVIVDVSETAQSNDGSTRKITRANLLQIAGDVVGTTDEQTLTNKTLTTPVIASLYQDAAKSKLMTIPNTSNDTLTANDATQTLSNKTLTTPVIASFYQDAAKTKLMTTPNTASDTLVTLAATQTLTGKTLTSPKINEDVAVTSTASEINITDGGNTAEKALNIQSKARAYLNTAVQSVASGSFVKILLNAENFDIGSDFDLANSKYIAPVNGYYDIKAGARVADLNAGTVCFIAIYINGAAVSYLSIFAHANGDDPRVAIADTQYMTASQYVELYVFHNHGSNRDVTNGSAETWLSVHLLSV